MGKVNVLHVADLYTLGGLETMLLDFLAKPAANFNFFVFSPIPISEHWQKKLNEYHISFQQASSERNWLKELAHYVRKYKIILAHLHNQRCKVGKTLKKNGVQVVIEQNHGSIWTRSSASISKDKLYCDFIDGVIAVSKACRLMLHKRMGYDLKKITTIYNGVNFERLKVTSPVPHPKGKKIILTVCRLATKKGLNVLIEAIPFVLAKRKDVEFWIVGTGPIKKELEELASRLKIGQYVKLWDKQTIVGNFFIASDIFVLTSIREPFGNVLVEAGYFAKPSIATNVDGIPEVIVNNETGILIDPTRPIMDTSPKAKGHALPRVVVDGKTKQLREPLNVDPHYLGEAILKLLDNPKLRRKMGKKAHHRAVHLFNIERYRNEIINFYYQQLRKKGLF